MHAQLGEGVAHALGMNRARGQRPFLFERSHCVRKQVGHRNAVDRLGGMSGEPSEDVGLVAALRENIPHRLHLARSAGHRTHATGLRIRLHESENAVLVGALSRGDGVPQHGRKNGPQCG